MDLVDLIAEKRFLGQEFLTWLWWKSEERGGSVELPDYGDILVEFEKHMLLEYGEDEYEERLICSGLQSELKEARTGLQTGKKIEQARVRLVKGDHEYHVTLGGTLMDFRSVRLPKTATESVSNESSREESEGLILERIFLCEEVMKIIDDLFRLFVTVRTSAQWVHELNTIRQWVAGISREG